MVALKNRLTALARGGALLALLALSVTLVVSAWANRRAAARISSLLDRGQADQFFHTIPPIHEQNHGPASSQDLQRLINQFQSDGLRYLAEYTRDGQLISEAGHAQGNTRPRPNLTAYQPLLVGERIQITFHPPPHARLDPPREPHAPPHDAAGAPHPAGEPPRDPQGGPEHPPHHRAVPLPDVVMEFEPTVANQLRERANKNFWFSATAATALLAVTLGLWLALRREDRNRGRSERERQLAALGEMSAVMAHEIRNPLASLKGHAQLLGEQLAGDERAQKKVDRIVQEAKRLEELTSALLDLVRSASVSRSACDPAQLLRDAADSLDAARIQVDADHAPQSWQLDAMRMDQVLKNLLQNALQAAPDGSPVEASVTEQGGKLVFVVRDHGEGLAAGSEQQIFEPFHTTRVKGTGLGLAIARRIVELHGGQIRAANHAEGGAVLTLKIPS